MTLQQLQYITAVETHGSFSSAAEKCFVTQPALSMMISRLEKELGVPIFEREGRNIRPTPTGRLLIDQAKKILTEAARIKEISEEVKGEMEGAIRIGIIPTLGPFLVAPFLKILMAKQPGISLRIAELTTEQIIAKLRAGDIDMGILATPLGEKGMKEQPVFYEPFVLYNCGEPLRKKSISQDELESLDKEKLLLMEDGHCFKNQVLGYCRLRSHSIDRKFDYRAGTIETLIKLTKEMRGWTVLPYLSSLEMPEKEKKYLVKFIGPVPSREISMVTLNSFVRKRLAQEIADSLAASVPKALLENEGLSILSVKT